MQLSGWPLTFLVFCRITEDNGTVAVTLDKVEGAGYTTNPQDTLLTFKVGAVFERSAGSSACT